MPIDKLVHGYVVAEERYPDNSVIIEENTKGDWVYVLLLGQVKVKKNTPRGWVTIDTLKEGAVFGEMALFSKHNALRTARIVADGPVVVGLLNRDRLHVEFESVSPQLKGLIKTLVSRLAETTQKASLLVD